MLKVCHVCGMEKEHKSYYSKDRLDKILRYIESKKGGVASVSYRPE